MASVRTRFAVLGVEVDVVKQGGVYTLSAVVFRGGNYVPPSVRGALELGPDYRLEVDEENHTVMFHLFAHHGSPQLVDEFVNRALEWRYFLEERGQEDLIHITI